MWHVFHSCLIYNFMDGPWVWSVRFRYLSLISGKCQEAMKQLQPMGADMGRGGVMKERCRNIRAAARNHLPFLGGLQFSAQTFSSACFLQISFWKNKILFHAVHHFQSHFLHVFSWLNSVWRPDGLVREGHLVMFHPWSLISNVVCKPQWFQDLLQDYETESCVVWTVQQFDDSQSHAMWPKLKMTEETVA